MAKQQPAQAAPPKIRLQSQQEIVNQVFPAADDVFTPSTDGVCRNLGVFTDATKPTCERAYTSQGKRFQIKLTEYPVGSEKLAKVVPMDDPTGQPGEFTTFKEPAGVRGTIKRIAKGGTVILRAVVDERNVIEIYGLQQDDTTTTNALFQKINIANLRKL